MLVSVSFGDQDGQRTSHTHVLPGYWARSDAGLRRYAAGLRLMFELGTSPAAHVSGRWHSCHVERMHTLVEPYVARLDVVVRHDDACDDAVHKGNHRLVDESVRGDVEELILARVSVSGSQGREA